MELLAIIICGGAAIACALFVILSKNTVHSALWMVANCLVLAVLFFLLNSQFIAILQVIVYAGAIMMFIIYAIMMLNVRAGGEDDLRKNPPLGRVLVMLLIAGGLITFCAGFSPDALKGLMGSQAMAKFGEVNLIANYIFVQGIAAFELVSVLLTAAVIGAVFLARKD